MMGQVFGNEWTLHPDDLTQRWREASAAEGSKGWLFREVGTDKDPWVIEILEDCGLCLVDDETGEIGLDLRP